MTGIYGDPYPVLKFGNWKPTTASKLVSAVVDAAVKVKVPDWDTSGPAHTQQAYHQQVQAALKQQAYHLKQSVKSHFDPAALLALEQETSSWTGFPTPLEKKMTDSPSIDGDEVLSLLAEAFPGVTSPAWWDWRKAVCPAREDGECPGGAWGVTPYTVATTIGDREVICQFEEWMRHDTQFTLLPDDDWRITSSRNVVSGLVQHLNDHHKWTYEQIADWLDTLDVDLTKKEH